MPVDAAFLRRFYAAPLGKRLARDCIRGLERYRLPAKTETLMGFGYTQPYLSALARNKGQCLAFMPAILADKPAAAGESAERGQKAVLVPEEHRFPLADAAADCLLAIHALEFCPDAQAMLREFRRVLAPNGRLILAVPNRRGLWAHTEKNPFGHGQPYSRGQLAELLRQNGFDFGEIYEYVHFLPAESRAAAAVSPLYEKLAAHFFPYFGGVLMVEAHKRLYNPLLTANIKRRLVFLPDFSPAPAARRFPNR